MDYSPRYVAQPGSIAIAEWHLTGFHANIPFSYYIMHVPQFGNIPINLV